MATSFGTQNLATASESLPSLKSKIQVTRAVLGCRQRGFQPCSTVTAFFASPFTVAIKEMKGILL